MARNAFLQCGWVDTGTTPTLGVLAPPTPSNGWYMGFPPIYPVATPVGPGSVYPVVIWSQEMFMEFARIKELFVDGSISIDVSGMPFGPYDVTGNIPQESGDGATSEKSLRLGVSRYNGTAVGGGAISVGIGVVSPIDTALTGYPTAAFLPPIEVIIDIDGGALLISSRSSNGPPYGAMIVTLTLSDVSGALHSHSIAMYGPAGGTSASGTVDIRAGLWWDYDGIYNPLTGTQLIFPLPTGL